MPKKQATKKSVRRQAGPSSRASDRAQTRSRNRLRPPRVLTYVDAVARFGSIRKAAEALNIASSALNRQILDLETDLGAPLFERLPRGVRLTSAGEAFLVYARLVISELKAVESRIEQLRGLVRGQVSVAAAESVAGELLPSAITEFQATHPYVRFHVRIGAPEELVEALAADQVDLILTHDVPRKMSPSSRSRGRRSVRWWFLIIRLPVATSCVCATVWHFRWPWLIRLWLGAVSSSRCWHLPHSTSTLA